MSEDSSSNTGRSRYWPSLPWGPFAGIAMVLFSFLIVQQVAGVLLIAIPYLLGWDSVRADEWVVNSPVSTFVFVVLAESMTIAALWWFLAYKKVSFWKTVGLQKPKFIYLLHAVAGYAAYFVLFIAVIAIVRAVLPIDVEQEQALGFQRTGQGSELAMAFVSLVLLPPLVEEIIFRGFFYGTLRSSRMRILTATVITSVVFGSLHLFGGVSDSLLWIAAIDTCILSVVLCYLRERIGSIWASIGVHAIKNGVVFVNLFILSSH